MSILPGFFRTIKYRLINGGYRWQSEKTSSQTVVMGDGTDNTDTLEKRAGSIKGLTSEVNVTETGYALDATIGKKHEDAITTLNNNLANISGNLKYLAGSITASYQSVNQLGASFDLTDRHVLKIYSGIATLNSYTSVTHKTSRIVVDIANPQRLNIYLYSDDNLYKSDDVVSVSWLIAYGGN